MSGWIQSALPAQKACTMTTERARDDGIEYKKRPRPPSHAWLAFLQPVRNHRAHRAGGDGLSVAMSRLLFFTVSIIDLLRKGFELGKQLKG